MLRPEFVNFISRDQTNQIYTLIGKLIQVLASSEVSIDDRHTPKLYARFLAGLLAKHQPGGSSSGRLHPGRPHEGQTQDPSGAGGQGPMGLGGGPTQGVFHINTSAQGGSMSPHGGMGSQRALGSVMGGVPDLVGQGQLASPLSITSTTTPMDTPVYEAEATYAIGTGPLELTSSEGVQFGLGLGFGGGGFGGVGGVGGYGAIQDEEMLATMHAIKNPAFWEDKMMPG